MPRFLKIFCLLLCGLLPVQGKLEQSGGVSSSYKRENGLGYFRSTDAEYADRLAGADGAVGLAKGVPSLFDGDTWSAAFNKVPQALVGGALVGTYEGLADFSFNNAIYKLQGDYAGGLEYFAKGTASSAGEFLVGEGIAKVTGKVVQGAKAAAAAKLTKAPPKTVGSGVVETVGRLGGELPDTGKFQLNEYLERGGKSLTSVFDGHGTGQGFSGVFDPETGSVLMKPSAYPSANGLLPEGFVSARGGHLALSNELGRNINHVGFTGFLEANGSLRMEWLSRSVNGPNPSFPGPVVPNAMRSSILDAIKNSTGRTAQ